MRDGGELFRDRKQGNGLTMLTFMSVNVRADREGADPRLRGILGSSFRKPRMERASLSAPEKDEAGAGVLSWTPSKPLGVSLGNTGAAGAV